MKWEPLNYQLRALKMVLSQGAAGLFLDPGLRKTSIMLAAIKVLLEKRLVRGVLVIAPLRVCYSVWPSEIKKWDEFSHLTYQILHGPQKLQALNTKADIYLMNPEGLEWLSRQKINADMLVCDESTLFKHSGTKRFKLLKALLNKFRRRYILTGTPVPNGYMDLFGQVYILDQGNALGRYITHYRMMFFYQTGFGGYEWRLLPGKDKEIEKRIKPLVMHMEAKDYLELPPLVSNVVPVELPKAARLVYSDFERDFIHYATTEDVLVALTAAAASMKLRQVANGAVYRDDHSWLSVHDAKLDAVEELVEGNGGKPVLIAYEFEHDLARLLERFGENTPWIGGGVSPKKSAELAEDWNAGRLPLLLGHPRSMGHGLNLQHGGNVLVWYSIPWDLELYDQTVRRLYRSGATDRVIVHHIVARETIDEVVMETLKRKNKTQKSLLEALKVYADQRADTIGFEPTRTSRVKASGCGVPQ